MYNSHHLHPCAEGRVMETLAITTPATFSGAHAIAACGTTGFGMTGATTSRRVP